MHHVWQQNSHSHGPTKILALRTLGQKWLEPKSQRQSRKKNLLATMLPRDILVGSLLDSRDQELPILSK